MLFTPVNGNEDGKSGLCEFCYVFAVISGANSLGFWKSAVNMKMWKTKFPIFGSIRLKMSEPVTICDSISCDSAIDYLKPDAIV